MIFTGANINAKIHRVAHFAPTNSDSWKNKDWWKSAKSKY